MVKSSTLNPKPNASVAFHVMESQIMTRKRGAIIYCQLLVKLHARKIVIELIVTPRLSVHSV